MKRFLAFVLISALGVFTIGCDSQKGTTQDKTETKTTQTKDGKTTGNIPYAADCVRCASHQEEDHEIT
jgi:hypothetical protein